MVQSELLQYLIQALERMGIPYLLTGSIATMYFGEPRLTNDIDVVDLPVEMVPVFLKEFPSPEYYLSEEAMREAILHQTQFNILHPSTGFKIDVMIPKKTPFNSSRLQRGLRIEVKPNYEASFASPEDVIIKKMEYYLEGGSEKHLRDITGVLKINGPGIDRAYIARWAQDMGLQTVWQKILQSETASR